MYIGGDQYDNRDDNDDDEVNWRRDGSMATGHHDGSKYSSYVAV